MSWQTMPIPSVITIDGPAASGKSTLGELLARQLGYTYFDTGVLYRALTFLALQRAVPLESEERLVALAQHIALQVEPPTIDDGRQYTVLANGDDITWQLRDKAVERHVSIVSAYPGVRSALREQQRAIGQQGQVVMVGRDIGSVVMPDADFKIFLRASPEERARRRYQELQRKGQAVDYQTVLRDLQRRDALDEQNTLLPDNAYVLENDQLNPADEVGHLIELFERRACA